MAAPVHKATVIRDFGVAGDLSQDGLHPGRDYRTYVQRMTELEVEPAPYPAVPARL